MNQSLEELLQDCTVKITVPGQSGWGTGFFVAPRLLLTCAHVVRKAADLQVTVFYPPRKQPLSAIVKAKVDNGKTLDLALVELSEPLSGHPCVLLDKEPVAIGQALYGYGYLESYTNAAPMRPVNEGLTGDTPPLLKLQSAQIEKGISGAALLNLRTGKVCGMVKETRATGFDLGGGAIPTSVILEQFPELRELQQAFHKGDLRWSELLPTTHSSETLSDQKVQGYLRSLSSHYERWWNIYRLTEAISARQSTFTFEQIAQTEEQSKEDPTKKETLPQLLQGIIDYAESESVLLVGSPGVGKSTTLLRLLAVLAKQELQNPIPRIPVLVRLKDYQSSLSSPEDSSGMLTLIQEALEPELSLEIADIKALLFQEKRLFLLLDGLNEIPSDVVRSKLTKFRDQCKRAKVPLICTTRNLGDDFGIQRRVNLQPLSPKEIHRFLSECVPGQEQQVLQLLNRGNQDLNKTPFVLWMLYDVSRESDQIPESLGEAFKRFTENYTNYKINQEGIPHPPNTLDCWSFSLKYLAFQMLKSPNLQGLGLVIAERQAVTILTQLPSENEIDFVQAQALLNNLLKYHLLKKSHKDEISFCHQLIQEYYAAEYLLRLLPTLSDDQLKQDYLNLLKWTEPIALMLSLVDKEEQALRVVKLAINDVDLILGARLVGAASIDIQKYILDSICKSRSPRKSNFSLFNKKRYLDVPDWLKIKVLKETQSTYAFTYLRILLRNTHPETRIKAIHALGQLNIDSQEIDSQEVVEELRMLQQDPDNLVREAANYTLKDFQFKRSITQKQISDLNRLLFDRVKNDQNNLISSKNERNEFQESQWPETLKGYLKSSNPDLRRDAVYTISQQGLTDLLPELFSMMDDPSPEVRRDIAKALGNFRVEEAVNQLTQFLDDDDLYVVANSCEALGKLGDSVAVPKLLKILADNFNLLSDESLTVTTEVCKSLGRLGDNLATTELSRVLIEHQVFWIREIAARSLGEISDTNSVKDLAYALKTDKSECVKWEVAKSLAHLGSFESVQFLSNGLDDSRQDRRRESIKFLEKLKPPNIHSLAIKALKDSDIIVSDIAARILIEIENQELIPKIIDLLKHQDSDIRWKAVRILKHYEANSLFKFLSKLTKTVYSELGEQAHDLVQHIQSSSGCQFYSYTVKQKKVRGNTKRLIEHRQNSSIRLLTQIDKTTQTISQKVEKMADEPRIENNINISGSPNSPINAPIGTRGVTQSKVTVSNSDPREGINWSILLAVFGIFVAIAAIPISMTVSGAFNEEFRQWFKQIFPAQIEQKPEYLED